MSYLITNQQRRAFVVAPIHVIENGASTEVHKSIVIDPGATEVVPAEHWEKVRKGNTVIEALLSGRHIVVNKGDNLDKAPEVRELQNPASPVAPSELTEDMTGVTLTTKTDVVEVALTPDAPASAPAPTRSRRA